MTRSPATVAEAVAARAKSLDWYVLRMQRLGISRGDLDRVYGGAFVSFYSFLEQSFEDLFMGVLMSRIDYGRPEVNALVTIRSERVARRAVLGGRKYADWLPYDYTRTRAEVFLSRGKPFTDMQKADSQTLDEMGRLRNALSHHSSYALRRFAETFTDGKTLPPDQKRPAGYLRGQHALGQTRLEFLFSQSVAIMRRLCF